MITTAILGYPGAGKTWAIYEFMKWLELPVPNSITNKIGLVEYHDVGEFVILGRYDGSKFQGTDRLSMAVARDFDMFFNHMELEGKKWIIAEGDRINNSTFLKLANQYKLERIKCDCNETTIRERRKQRNHEFNPKFLKTIYSKVDKHNFDYILNSGDLLQHLKMRYGQIS